MLRLCQRSSLACFFVVECYHHVSRLLSLDPSLDSDNRHSHNRRRFQRLPSCLFPQRYPPGGRHRQGGCERTHCCPGYDWHTCTPCISWSQQHQTTVYVVASADNVIESRSWQMHSSWNGLQHSQATALTVLLLCSTRSCQHEEQYVWDRALYIPCCYYLIRAISTKYLVLNCCQYYRKSFVPELVTMLLCIDGPALIEREEVRGVHDVIYLPTSLSLVLRHQISSVLSLQQAWLWNQASRHGSWQQHHAILNAIVNRVISAW